MSGPGRNYEHLHNLYRQLTGRDETYIPFATEYDWQQWCALWKHREPWTPENGLRLVIAYRHWEIRKGRRHPASLAFRNLIRDAAQADDLIADALVACRNSQKARMPVAKEEIMRATGRPTELSNPPVRKIDEILESKAFQEFVNLKKTL